MRYFKIVSKIKLYQRLSYIVTALITILIFNTSSTSVSAISNTPTNINTGDIIKPDSYFTVGDFTIPKTISADFRNNSFISSVGNITPTFGGDDALYIPSAETSNAIAAFNQPIDPTKDFEISAEISVADARIAAAGIYISDITPNNIIANLGVSPNNWPGSSGTLKNEPSSYTGHYMIFSGFHNSGGYAAILASGTEYERITSGGSPSGPSKYMDDDYVSFRNSYNNVKVLASIKYKSTTGILTVTYTHDSGSTLSAKNAKYNGYTSTNKTATVQFKINTSQPIYLGIVGNGNDSKNRNSKTSRSKITSLKGNYIEKSKEILFKDDGGNTLAPSSKILLPLGARLAIGNNDTASHYYFEKPDMPKGYTYDVKQNPSVQNKENIVVIYQRDSQTGYVERYNKLNHKQLDSSKNTIFKGLTNQVLSLSVTGYPGYYYEEEIVGDAVNPKCAADGSSISFDITMDDTANGTSATDKEEQIVKTFMTPSVQERILTITKPDGTLSVEKQTTTTDTDFPAIAGDYNIPGYRIVIDGKRITGEEVKQGIPGEATDRTDNLKSLTDKEPQRHTVTYEPELQVANISYKDITTQTVLKTDRVTGQSDTLISYDTHTNISDYIKHGYILKSSNFTDGAEKFDKAEEVEQDYLIELVRDSEKKSETKDIIHEIVYTSSDNSISLPMDYTQKVSITYSYFIDKVTKTKIINGFNKYGANGLINSIPENPLYASNDSKIIVDSDGMINFPYPLTPDIQGYKFIVTKNNKVNYFDAKKDAKMISTVLYELDDSINVTIPTNTIFYNTKIDPVIKSPVYTIKNNSANPVKISIDGFSSNDNSTERLKDFTLNLIVTGKKVLASNTTLIENSSVKKVSSEILMLSNFKGQYDISDGQNINGSVTNNIGNFTFSGSSITSDTQKLNCALKLKFDSIKL